MPTTASLTAYSKDLHNFRTPSPATTGNIAAAACHNWLSVLEQHKSEHGWLVLIAPAKQLTKSLLEHYQLPINRILIIHHNQISNLSDVITKALSSEHCKVIINFADKLSPSQQTALEQLATTRKKHFYQLNTIQQPNHH